MNFLRFLGSATYNSTQFPQIACISPPYHSASFRLDSRRRLTTKSPLAKAEGKVVITCLMLRILAVAGVL